MKDVLLAVIVAKADILKADIAPHGLKLFGIRHVNDLGLCVQVLEYALRRRHRTQHATVDTADSADRLPEAPQIVGEGHDVADGQIAAHRHPRAEPEYKTGTRQAKDVHQWPDDDLDLDGTHKGIVVGIIEFVELGDIRLLTAKGLGDTNPRD